MPMDCDFEVPDPDARPDRKVCRREACGRVVTLPLPPELIYATCRVGKAPRPPSKPQAVVPPPPPLTFESGLKCVHRGKLLGTVPNGLCCGGGYPVRVAVCREFAVCSEEPVANTKAQRIHGVRPTPCDECQKRAAAGVEATGKAV